MNRVKVIESQVSEFTPEELAVFRQWFQNFDSELWDRKIEEDAKAGRFDALANEALDQHRRGKTSDL